VINASLGERPVADWKKSVVTYCMWMQALFALANVIVFTVSLLRLCCTIKREGMSVNKKVFALHFGIILLFGLSEGFNSYATIAKKQLGHYLTMVCLYLFCNFVGACLVSMVMVKIAWAGFGDLKSFKDMNDKERQYSIARLVLGEESKDLIIQPTEAEQVDEVPVLAKRNFEFDFNSYLLNLGKADPFAASLLNSMISQDDLPERNNIHNGTVLTLNDPSHDGGSMDGDDLPTLDEGLTNGEI